MTRDRRAGAAAVIVLAVLAAVVVDGQDTKPTLRYGFTEGALEGASPNDARAASLLWAQGIADAIGLYGSAEATILQTPQAALTRMYEGSLDLLAISMLEYLSVENQLKCVPAMVWSKDGETMVEYVLVARTGTRGIAGVAGKTLTMYAPNRPWALAELWLDVLLSEAGAPGRPVAPASVKIVGKKGHAAMAVFFQQADYAVEPRSAFETAIELNPQLGRDLTVVARSPRLLPGLVCLSEAMGPERRQQYVERAVRLHELARYRQVFMALQITRFAPANPRDLDSARALVRQHRLLQTRRRDSR